ncbi:MAG: rod shape-determining protein [Anaerolineae bacterium]|nr:rod shape-determining protein [Gloeobacterales cyanobacterium ES-bin-313]
MNGDQGKAGSKPLLPKLKADATVATPSEAASWVSVDGVILANLAESLVVPDLSATQRSIDSIPDIWARPLLFKQALHNNEHPLHLTVLGEWRGLLAILALREWRNLRLYTKLLDLKNPPDTGYDFIRAANSLLPRHQSISPDTTWDKVHILFYGDEPQGSTKGNPIGITSPLTLVCTAADLASQPGNEKQSRLDERVTWFISGMLEDPSRHLDPEEKHALTFWLNHVKKGLQSGGRVNRDASELIGRLNEFVVALRADRVPAREQHSLSSRSLALQTGIYRILDNPVKGIETPLHQSMVRVKPSASLNPPKDLLILDESFKTKLGIWRRNNLAEIRVFGTENLGSINFAELGDNPNRLGSRAGAPQLKDGTREAEWRFPKALFTERLMLVRAQGTTFPNVLPVSGQRDLIFRNVSVVPILPIDSKLLDYYIPSDLAERIHFRQEGENFIVELMVTLGSSSEESVEEYKLTIDRVYTPQDVEFRENLPVLEIWPNFRTPTWNCYYTYYDLVGLEPTDVFYARPYTGTEEVVKRSTLERELLLHEVTRTSKPPEAMICEAVRKDKRRFSVGCLLLTELPFKNQMHQSIWHIGMDFGTSASQVYYRRDTGNIPKPLQFQQRFFSVTSPGEENRFEMVKFYLPPFEPVSPFPTLFRQEPKLPGNQQDPYDQPFLRGNIRYSKEGQLLRGLANEKVSSRFKWAEEQELTDGFIEQLALQCLAEAASEGVAEVRWHVSYPTAFDFVLLQILRNTWGCVLTMTRDLGFQTDDKRPNFMTESVAAALFFSSKDKVNLTQTVCIDIGGGSSDISIWSKTELIQQSSIKFAGEEIFMNLLKAYPLILERFDPEWGKQLAKVVGSESFYPEADSLLRANRDKLKQRLPIALAQVRDPMSDPVFGLIHLIALGVSGIVFYSGLLINQLHRQGALPYDVLPELCVGGNGARTFEWLGIGEFSEDTPHNRLFAELLVASSELERVRNYAVRVSSEPKAEVAYGLVLQDELHLEVKKNDEDFIVIAGEDFKDEKGEPKGWDTLITAGLLKSGLSISKELTQLRKFVEVYNNYASKKGSCVRAIDLDAYAKDIEMTVQQKLDSYKRMNESNITVEPLFITALKRLIVAETQKWSGKKS